MYPNLSGEFLKSPDTLRVYKDEKLVFSSSKELLLPLIEYLDICGDSYPQVVIFDKIMGNAAALLTIRANSSEVFSPLGSELATRTLRQYGVRYFLTKVVPTIGTPGGEMCPMEKLSIGKKPEEFYQLMKKMVGK